MTGTETTPVTKLLTYTGLALLGWLALCTAWAVTARVTGLPGPASAAYATVDLAASGIEAGHLPGPFSTAQRAAARQVRASGEVVARLYRVPERLAARLLNRADHRWRAGNHRWRAGNHRWRAGNHRWRAGEREGSGGFGDHVAPADRRVRVELEVARDLERSVAPRIEAEAARIEAEVARIEAEVARIEAITPRIEARIAREIEARLERARRVEERIRRVERAPSGDLSSGGRQR